MAAGAGGGNIVFDAVVGQGPGDEYATVSEAIDDVPKKRKTPTKRYFIRVKPGKYLDRVIVADPLVTIIGDDPQTTIIHNDRSYSGGFKTHESATFNVKGAGFVGKNLTIQNTAGEKAGQAVALLAEADKVAFENCFIVGWQDTLYANTAGNRIFFKSCKIYGSVDFIFGSARAYFQDCLLLARREGNANVVTAQSKAGPQEKSGYVFDTCSIAADPKVKDKSKVKAYLGRPWRLYSTVVYILCCMDSLVDPAGWIPWSDQGPVDNVFYAEYKSRGCGAPSAGRVKWARVIADEGALKPFTLDNFINGSEWLPESGVSFRPRLKMPPSSACNTCKQ